MAQWQVAEPQPGLSLGCIQLLLVGDFSNFTPWIISHLRLKPKPLMGRPTAHKLVDIWPLFLLACSGEMSGPVSPRNTQLWVCRLETASYIYFPITVASTGGPGRRWGRAAGTKKCVYSDKFGELTLRLFQGENDVLNKELLYIWVHCLLKNTLLT